MCNKHYIPDQAVGCILSYPVLYFSIQMLSFLGGEGSSFSLEKDQAGRFVSRITVSTEYSILEYNSLRVQHLKVMIIGE